MRSGRQPGNEATNHHIVLSSLVPRPSTPPVFDCLQYAIPNPAVFFAYILYVIKTGGVEGMGMLVALCCPLTAHRQQEVQAEGYYSIPCIVVSPQLRLSLRYGVGPLPS